MKDFYSLSVYSKITYICQNLCLTIAIIGVLGNILSISVLSRKSLRKYSYSFYIRLMNAFDVYTLLYVLRHWFAFMLDSDLRFVSNLFCKLSEFSVYFTTGCSLFLLTVITIDRFVSIVFPKRFAIFQKRGFHVFQAGLVIAYSFFCNLPMLINMELIVTSYHDNQTNTTVVTQDCVLVNNTNELIYWMALINPIWVITLNTTLSAIIIVKIYKSRAKLKISNNNNSSRDRKFAIAMIAQNVSCVLCKTPIVIFTLINAYLGLDYEKFVMFLTVTITIYLIESADSPLVNFIFNPIFKNEVLSLFKFLSRKDRSSTTGTGSLTPSVKESTKN